MSNNNVAEAQSLYLFLCW